MLRQGVRIGLLDLFNQFSGFLGHKWASQRSQIKHKNSKCPYVDTVSVFWFVTPEFWGHLEWSSTSCLRNRPGEAQDARDPKVAKLDVPVLGDENILWLDVSMNDFVVMAVFEAEANLCEDIQNFVLREIFPTF